MANAFAGPEAFREADVLIAGASARAACDSARRAGFKPAAADLFADCDLRLSVPALRIPRAFYPKRLPEFLGRLPALPLLYTGGLENHPEVVEALAARHPILGCGPAVLRRVRDPFLLRGVLAGTGFEMVEILPGTRRPAALERWLCKPYRGAGGAGVGRAADCGPALQPPPYFAPAISRDFAPATSSDFTLPASQYFTVATPPDYTFATSRQFTLARSRYFARRMEGGIFSAVLLASEGGVRLFGVTRQLAGEAWLGAPPFAYAGNVGPVEVPEALARAILRAGEAIAGSFGVRGIFGIDFIAAPSALEGLPDSASVRVLEVNPRYTAAVEVLEYARGIPALAAHFRAFGLDRPGGPEPARRGLDPADSGRERAPCGPEPGRPPPEPAPSTQEPAPPGPDPGPRAPPPQRRVIGKAVVYAERDLEAPEIPFAPPRSLWTLPEAADLPEPGTPIPQGSPVLTLFAEGRSATECLENLHSAALRLRAAYGKPG